MMHSTVRVITDSIVGSGMIYEIEDENVLIVTAGHVAENTCKCRISFYDDTQCEGTVIKSDSSPDIALIEVASAALSKETSDGLAKTKSYGKAASNDAGKIPKDFWCVVPEGMKSGQTLIKGTVESKEEYFYELDATLMMGYMEAYEGYSGSPMFDEYGTIIGIITAGSQEGIVAGVGTDEIRNWCSKVCK